MRQGQKHFNIIRFIPERLHQKLSVVVWLHSGIHRFDTCIDCLLYWSMCIGGGVVGIGIIHVIVAVVRLEIWIHFCFFELLIIMFDYI